MEGLLSTGPTPSSFYTLLVENVGASCANIPTFFHSYLSSLGVRPFWSCNFIPYIKKIVLTQELILVSNRVSQK